MLNDMLLEIQHDYFESMRKAILDYVLKDEEERLRIGIMMTFREVTDYGENIFQGIEPADEWKEHVNESRD